MPRPRRPSPQGRGLRPGVGEGPAGLRLTPAPVLAELVMLLEWWSCTECTLFTDRATVERLGKEHVVIILNHNFEIDFLCGWTMCERFGVLGVRAGAGAGWARAVGAPGMGARACGGRGRRGRVLWVAGKVPAWLPGVWVSDPGPLR